MFDFLHNGDFKCLKHAKLYKLCTPEPEEMKWRADVRMKMDENDFMSVKS